MKAYQLLDSQEKWIRFGFARDANGHTTKTLSEDAAKWCISGAIFRCYFDAANSKPLNDAREAAEKALFELHGHRSFITFNDDFMTSYEDVITVLRHADV